MRSYLDHLIGRVLVLPENQHAGVNQAAIPYYFGGKEGLYLAVIEHVIVHKDSRLRPILLRISARLQQEHLTPAEAVNQIKGLFTVYLQVLLEDRAATTWARIIMCEQMQPTNAFGLLYERWLRLCTKLLARLLRLFCRKGKPIRT